MIVVAGVAAMEALAARLATVACAGDTVALSGALGAGKTSFARGFLRGLGFAGEVPSPTFTLVQPYGPPETCLPVWHVDLYRLTDAREAEALALEEAGDAVVLIEWPERLGGALAAGALWLAIDGAGGAERRLTARVPPAWEGRWPPP